MALFRTVDARLATLRVQFVLAVCIGVQLAASADPARISVTFSETHIDISGATPNRQVALVGLMREPLGFHSRVTPVAAILEAGRDGAVRYELTSKQAWKSVWGAVDLTTGDFVVSRPQRSPGRQIDFKGKGLGRAANGKLSQLQHEGQWLQLMLVRPGGDVWHSVIVDGGPFDEDGDNDNVVNVKLESLWLIRGAGEKPDEYRSGDVLFVIDADELTMVAVKVK